MENTQISNTVSMPRIGEIAPSFEAITTQGNIKFPSDYSGNWVILFSHPERSIFPQYASMQLHIDSHSAILSFIGAFGFTKALANYFTGKMANSIGRFFH